MRKILTITMKLLGALALSGALAAIVAVFYFQQWLTTPLHLPSSGYTYQLQSGRVLGHLAQDLAQQGVLKHPRLLTLYARISDATKIHAGEYYLHHGITPQELLDKLRKGDVVLYQATLVEGWTFRQALTLLHSKDTIKPLLKDKTTAEQLALLELPIEHPEGWFFPDTYVYSRGSTDVEILRRAYSHMQQLLQELWDARAENLPYKNAYEALIMASIVERETGAEWERDQVAGVFVRRLQRGMRLQTDPTVIYGMGEAYKGKITRKDLQEATPYNTYVIRGLPPTPISLPGRAALQATLNPAEGDALYFVAKGDGTTHFSATLAEHNRAVRRYQLNRRSDYRSTIQPGQAAEQPVNP